MAQLSCVNSFLLRRLLAYLFQQLILRVVKNKGAAEYHGQNADEPHREQDFDDITVMASQMCQTPMSLISLVDVNRQWFKSRVGLTLTRAPRNISLCAHVVATALPLVVEDTLRDVRFADNPLVTDAPRIRTSRWT